MSEHFCQLHNCKFYKNEKNGKTWYSHKIKDGSGYCNEQKEGDNVQRPASTPPPIEWPETKPNIPPEVKELADQVKAKLDAPVKGDTRDRSMSISYAKDLAVAGKITPGEITAYADVFLHYITK
jgi:hypothetical protein